MPVNKPTTRPKMTATKNIKKPTKAAKPALRKSLSRAVKGCDAEIGVFLLMLTRLGRINEGFAAPARQNFSVADLLVLTVLLMEEFPHRLPPTELADRVIQSPGGMTKTLQRLEAQGLVQRSREESDRRALSVELTDAGIEATQEHFREIIDRYGQLVAEISGKDRNTVKRALRILLNVLEPATGARDTREWLN
jgi:DNA-binding MarR family transcriptional regulator